MRYIRDKNLQCLDLWSIVFWFGYICRYIYTFLFGLASIRLLALFDIDMP